MRLPEESGGPTQGARGDQSIDVSLEPARVGRWLVAVLALLLVAHGGGLLMTYGFGHGYVFGLVPLFNIATEGNVPTFFASSLFVIGGVVFLLLWRLSEEGFPERRVWLVLGVIFFFLAVDEFAVVHELLIVPVREGLNTGGLLFFAWIIPYSVGVLALAVWVAPKLWRLGGRFRLLFGLSAGAFLSGAAASRCSVAVTTMPITKPSISPIGCTRRQRNSWSSRA